MEADTPSVLMRTEHFLLNRLIPRKADIVKPRVVLIVNTLEFGGLEKHLLELARRLDASNAECTILCYGADFYSQRLTDRPGVHVATPSTATPKSVLSYWLTFLKFRPHVVVFSKGSVDCFPLQAYVAARLSGARRVVAIEQLIADPVPPRVTGKGMRIFLRQLVGWRTRHIISYVWMIRLSEMLTHAIICVSTEVRDRLVNEYGYPPHKTVAIPNGVNLHHFGFAHGDQRERSRSRLGLDPNEIIILCVTRLVPRKRVDVLLDALALVSKQRASCKCIIVGTGPLENELRTRSKELGLSTLVHFVGFAEDVRPYLEAADVYVSASEREGLPLSLTEAMAYGLPAIVTDISGHNEAVLHRHNGLLVRPGSVEDLAEAIRYLVLHEEERRRMATHSRRRAEELYNMDETMARIEHVLLSRT
jgi:glycosyltransferase involved in cell wall biosynthesis